MSIRWTTNMLCATSGFLLNDTEHCASNFSLRDLDLDFLTFEDGTDMLSRNVGTELPLYAA